MQPGCGDLAGVEEALRNGDTNVDARSRSGRATKRACMLRVATVISQLSECSWMRARIQKPEIPTTERHCMMLVPMVDWKSSGNWFEGELIFSQRTGMEALHLTFQYCRSMATPLSPNFCSSTIDKRSLRMKDVGPYSRSSSKAIFCSDNGLRYRLEEGSVWINCCPSCDTLWSRIWTASVNETTTGICRFTSLVANLVFSKLFSTSWNKTPVRFTSQIMTEPFQFTWPVKRVLRFMWSRSWRSRIRTRIRERDGCGNLPLHIACLQPAPFQVIQYLVQQDSATLHISNKDGALPIHLACQLERHCEPSSILLRRMVGLATVLRLRQQRMLFRCMPCVDRLSRPWKRSSI